jgi:hypothetical protein
MRNLLATASDEFRFRAAVSGHPAASLVRQSLAWYGARLGIRTGLDHLELHVFPHLVDPECAPLRRDHLPPDLPRLLFERALDRLLSEAASRRMRSSAPDERFVLGLAAGISVTVGWAEATFDVVAEAGLRPLTVPAPSDRKRLRTRGGRHV